MLFRWLFVLCVSLPPILLGFDAVSSQTSSSGPQNPTISTQEFKLLTRPVDFALQFVSKGKTKQVAIPRDWLVPPEDEEAEESGAYVSSFNYDSQVQSFPIGNGRIGLHLSSFDLTREGTSKAAAGRDVFLIFDPISLEIFQGGFRPGITKGRVRAEGCLSAAIEHYYVADVNGDGLTDIGVVSEELQCIEKSDGWMAGPFYKQHPVVWYLLRGTGWTLEPRFYGKFPEHYQEVPLIGIGRSPVDFVGCGLSQSCDRARWPHEIHTATAHGVTAHFGGQEPIDKRPLQVGVSALWFTFEGDPRSYGFASMTKEPGDAKLYFSDWSLDIFSPDGAYVLLLQDHYGPYHVVATDKLKDYLAGERKPEYVVTKATGPNEPARVHNDGHWISTREIQFTVSCCGSSETITYALR